MVVVAVGVVHLLLVQTLMEQMVEMEVLVPHHPLQAQVLPVLAAAVAALMELLPLVEQAQLVVTVVLVVAVEVLFKQVELLELAVVMEEMLEYLTVRAGLVAQTLEVAVAAVLGRLMGATAVLA